jgi:hypothetical protein
MSKCQSMIDAPNVPVCRLLVAQYSIGPLNRTIIISYPWIIASMIQFSFALLCSYARRSGPIVRLTDVRPWYHDICTYFSRARLRFWAVRRLKIKDWRLTFEIEMREVESQSSNQLMEAPTGFNEHNAKSTCEDRRKNRTLIVLFPVFNVFLPS